MNMYIDFTNVGTFTAKVTEQWATVHDHNGDQIYYTDPSHYQEWCEYNDGHNIIHFKTNDNNEAWWEYDSEGRELTFADNSGFNSVSEYDENGIEIHYQNSVGAKY